MLLINDSEQTRWLKLNRPEVRNALLPELMRQLTQALNTLPPNCRAIVLKGEGSAFCAGADLGWMKNTLHSDTAALKAEAETLATLLKAMTDCPVPVITVAHGSIYGGGIGLLAASDIVIALESTRFCLSEVKLGLIPAVISPWVVRKIGVGWFQRLALTAEVFELTLAHNVGLVHDMVRDREHAESRIQTVLTQLASAGPEAVSRCKVWGYTLGKLPFPQQVTQAIDLITICRQSEEGQAGMQAFLEKVPPPWA